MRPRCDVGEADTIALYFYGELVEVRRAEVRRHLNACGACRQTLEELTAIDAALATADQVAAPAGGDWSGFMSRLDARVRTENRSPASSGHVSGSGRDLRIAQRAVAGLAIAAALVLVTAAVLWEGAGLWHESPAVAVTEAPPAPPPAPGASAPDPVLAAVSGQHFARSKVVVLGLATRDTTAAEGADWRVERDLASSLLSDTRLYRMAAEDRGMTSLAGVMRDLELVLLEASMTPEPDRHRLEQVQRLIGRRDLLTKMSAAYVDRFD